MSLDYCSIERRYINVSETKRRVSAGEDAHYAGRGAGGADRGAGGGADRGAAAGGEDSGGRGAGAGAGAGAGVMLKWRTVASSATWFPLK